MSYTFSDAKTICPYNSSHVLSHLRALSHVMKCRKQHPNLAKSIQICPYNQAHHVPSVDMNEHFKSCRDYSASQSYDASLSYKSIATSSLRLAHQNVQADNNPKTSPQVDEDLEEWQ